MTHVYLYSGKGKFVGTQLFEWNSPEVGSSHQFILFLAQVKAESDEEAAFQELVRYGFADFVVSQGKPIVVETLNEPRMQAFQKYYEGAFHEGSSIVWYP